MPKQLILFRHGKSDWDANFNHDHERPLAKRGKKAARLMGQVLTAANQRPDRVITSTAVRARTTAEIAQAAGDWPCPLQVTDELYEASLEQVLRVIQGTVPAVETLLLVGHQPTWSASAAAFIGGGDLAVPTAAMVCITFDIDTWPAARWGGGSLKWLLPPKFFRQGFALPQED